MGALDFLMNEIHLVTRRKRGIRREKNIDDEKVCRRIFDIAFSRIGRVAIIATYQII